MSTPRSASEILAAYGNELQTVIGSNVLQDPLANRADPLVRLLSMAALSLSDLESLVESRVIQQNPNNLEGISLTSFAASRGIFKKFNTSSKAIVIVTGQQGSILPQGSVLTDRFGGAWLTQAEIVLNSTGAGCAFSQGTVCAEDPGSFSLTPGELSFDNTGMSFIFAATNGDMIEVGGEEESDESLRLRLDAAGPFAAIVGTRDNAVNALFQVDDVNYVRFAFVDNCAGQGPMFIVSGGEDSQICSTLETVSGISGNLIGESSCGDCSSIKFQRPCPLLLKIRVTLNNECADVDEDALRSLIMSTAPQLARQQRVRSGDISSLQSEIDSVSFSLQRQPLVGCLDDQDEGVVRTLTDPLTMQPFIFATDQPTGLCYGVPICDEEETFSSVVAIQPWEYFVLDQADIEFSESAVSAEDDCNACR